MRGSRWLGIPFSHVDCGFPGGKLTCPPTLLWLKGSGSIDIFIIQKGAEKWEVARDATTKVTVSYTVTATSIEAKTAKPAGKAMDKVMPKKTVKP